MNNMKKILFLILILLFSCSYSNAGILAGGLADNSSAAEGFNWATVKAAEFRFEDGALGTDSSGAGNTVTTAAGFTVDTTNYKQGSASAAVNQSTTGIAYLANASLSAGFPGKSSDGNSNFLVMGWARPHEVTTGGSLVGKYYAADTYRSWEIHINTSYFRVYSSDDGLSPVSINYSFTAANGGLTLEANTWYHFAFWIDETIGQYGMIIYEAVAGEKKYSADLPAAFESELYDGLAYFTMGGRWDGSTANTSFDGNIDQVVIYTWASGSGPTETQIENQVSAVRGGTAP